MKHSIVTFLIITLMTACSSVLVMCSTVKAHPGNTASDGGHYCWTNCEQWGYTYGTRHFHNIGTPTYVSDWSQGYDAGKEHARTKNNAYIKSNATGLAKIAGYNDGYGDKSDASAIYDAPICEIPVTFTNTPSDSYRSGFNSGYETECLTIYKSEYEIQYKPEYKKGKDTLTAERTELERKKQEENNKTIFAILGIIGFVCFAGLVKNIYYKND